MGTLGGYSEAVAINNLGQVVGDSYTVGGSHAFVTDLATMQMVDLNTQIPPDSGWTLFEASAINDAGQIVGTGQLPGYNNVHAYLLTPNASPAFTTVAVADVLPVLPSAPIRAQQPPDARLAPDSSEAGREPHPPAAPGRHSPSVSPAPREAARMAAPAWANVLSWVPASEQTLFALQTLLWEGVL
jgi:probable HAF family extracellular repeat protein